MHKKRNINKYIFIIIILIIYIMMINYKNKNMLKQYFSYFNYGEQVIEVTIYDKEKYDFSKIQNIIDEYIYLFDDENEKNNNIAYLNNHVNEQVKIDEKLYNFLIEYKKYYDIEIELFDDNKVLINQTIFLEDTISYVSDMIKQEIKKKNNTFYIDFLGNYNLSEKYVDGDIYKVAVQYNSTSEAIDIVKLSDCNIVTLGEYNNFKSDNYLSVSVISDSELKSNMIAKKALMLDNSSAISLADEYNVAIILVDKDKNITYNNIYKELRD